jgi:hypothetical protein
MTLSTTRTRAARHSRPRRPRYPHDYLHEDRSYEQTQHDIGGGLLLGAVTLVVLMGLIVTGLLL